MKLDNIRNFCIIAHIDHGKSTLADRFLELTGVISKKQNVEQVLDDMDLERERGITIKARAVRLPYEKNGKEYTLNLIDTPGHVDFSYEVSRALAACEGAILLVDASQGVEAQTVANMYLAIEAGLETIPVLNKTDLDTARPDDATLELHSSFGTEPDEVLDVSAKTGDNVPELLDALVGRIPPPEGDPEKPLRALVFDAVFDDYRGVIVYVRIIDGGMKRGSRVKMLRTEKTWEVTEVGIFQPSMQKIDSLTAGNVGYFTASIKILTDVQIGDTVAPAKGAEVEPLPGYQEPKPMVFCGIYPTQPGDFENLRKALEKLALNDSSFTFEPESSDALGFGFRCGFLGLLHMEIVQERLERESGVDIVQTAPTVKYEILTTANETILIDSPAKLPEPNLISEFREPIARVRIICPAKSIGTLMTLNQNRRGKYVKQEYLSQTRVILEYDIPLSEIIYDYYDKLKSATHGYGTLDYEVTGYKSGRLVKLSILVNEVPVDALSTIVHREVAERRGRALIRKLKKEIPRHMFQIPLQAAIGGRVVARETISPMRKNVTAKCYGGDVTRKRKLLEKQKAGKKRMKQVGNVEIPQKAFMAVLKVKED
ncbi:MAG: elongation factor 4 [Planctomycetota bacterium]|nr:MAG: elongation factor 4 [Planctomycetota bacterium]